MGVAFSGLQKKCGGPFLTSDRDLAPTFNNTSMVKAYLRYEPTASFGVINSTLSNIIYDATGKLAIAPALEQVILWDLKKGTKVRLPHSTTHSIADRELITWLGWTMERIQQYSSSDMYRQKSQQPRLCCRVSLFLGYLKRECMCMLIDICIAMRMVWCDCGQQIQQPNQLQLH